MISLLTQIQNQVTAEIKKIGESVAYAADQLSTAGLSGDQANEILSALAANSSFIIDALTADSSNHVAAVMPQTYSDLMGTYLGEPDYISTSYRENIEPTMTSVMSLVERYERSFFPVFSDRSFLHSQRGIFASKMFADALHRYSLYVQRLALQLMLNPRHSIQTCRIKVFMTNVDQYRTFHLHMVKQLDQPNVS
jgi:hypothetical protein